MATTKATLLGHRSATSFSDLTLSGDLTVNGTTTTLDTAVQNVDKLEIGASSTDYGAKINQASTGNILQLQDGGTDVMVVADGGSTTFSLEDGVTNAVTTVATLRHTSSGTTANGFGTGLRFEGEQPNGGTNIPMASINTVWTNGSAEESDLRFQTGDGGVLSDVMTLTKDGNVGIGGVTSPTGTLHIQQSSTGISGSNSDVLTLEKDAETVSINMISDTDRKSNILFSDTTRAQGRIQFDQSSRELSLWTSDASPQLLIDSSGKVGIGLTPSQGKLHISQTGTGNSNRAFFWSMTGGHGLGLYNDGSDNVLFGMESQQHLQFMTNAVARMTIDKANGKVGINCTPTTGNLDLLQASDALPNIRLNKSSNTTTSAQVFLEFVTNGQNQTANGRIVGNGSGSAAFASWSDERLKENITPLTSQLDVINSLKPVKFNWKSNGEHGVGFIAQEFQNVFPKQVSTDSPTEEQIDNEETGTMSIAGWSSTEAILVSAIQELSAKVIALENATN